MAEDLQRFTRAAEARAARAQQLAQAQIDALAAAAFDRMWRWLQEHPGVDPRAAILAAQVEFGGAFAEALAASFGELLQRSVGTAQVRVGEITLSQRLYRHAAATAGEVTALVREHAKGVHQARELALRLYDGYEPGDGIRRPLEGSARADLPKALRALTDDSLAREELTRLVERGQAQAARLKSPALRAAYSEAFDAWEAGAGREALKRKLKHAQFEKNRYFAERIARTELHRAHQDEVAAEFMADEQTTVVQVRLNPAHPVTDICDYHAKADLWGLGPGCYPKAKAPVPPYHPHCWCRLRSRPDLDAADARVQPGAAQAFLRGMPPADAARVLGSKERLYRALNGADPVDIVDQDVSARYRTRRAGAGSEPSLSENPRVKPHLDAVPHADRAVIPRAKLESYLLDPQHESGKHKAKVFASALGFGQHNWQALQRAILDGLPTAPAVPKAADSHGQRFQADIDVTGPAGSATVRTGWIVRQPNAVPQLVTAKVLTKGSK